MHDIASKRFTSPLGIDEMLVILRGQPGQIDEWRIQDSEYDGRYVRGTLEGAKVRIVEYPGYYDAELWFGAESEEHRSSLVHALDDLLVKTLQAVL